STVAGQNDGFIYGKISTKSGNSYVGILRWDDEEAFWDDLFHSSKDDLPFEKYVTDKKFKDDKNVVVIEDDETETKELKKEERRLEKEKNILVDEIAKLESKMDKVNKSKQNDELKESLLEVKANLGELLLELNEIQEELRELQEDNKTWFWESGSNRRTNDRVISVLGGAIKIDWHGLSSRQFIARFGDIQRIDVTGRDAADVYMKSGTVYSVSGYSNDVGTTINVRDESLGDVSVKWDKIESIEFLPTSNKVQPDGYRVYGKVATDVGEFNGFIQWDSQECLSTDKIDGDSEDGRLAIDLGKIRKIERRNRNSSWVELKDGRKMMLDGTNDVDGSIRGILVEDERFGRVKVSWDAFDYAEFTEVKGSGKGYKDFPNPRNLEGTVTDVDGNTFKGRLIYDIDEAETFEMLNGDLYDVEYSIPFSNVKSVRPRGGSSSIVVLKSGEELRLENSQDVTGSHDGMLIFVKGNDTPRYIRWDDVDVVEFD
ncbi:hypothetical protein K8I28_01700, partial [bacterium]|nr:hypothetical protein [bacterium]